MVVIIPISLNFFHLILMTLHFQLIKASKSNKTQFNNLTKHSIKSRLYLRAPRARIPEKHLTNLRSKNELPRLPRPGLEKKNVSEVLVKEIRFKLDTSVLTKSPLKSRGLLKLSFNFLMLVWGI